MKEYDTVDTEDTPDECHLSDRRKDFGHLPIDKSLTKGRKGPAIGVVGGSGCNVVVVSV